MSIREYRLHCKARQIQMIDELEAIHRQAFENFRVKAVSRGGKPKYSTFAKFFNRKKIEDALEGKKETATDETDKKKRLAKMLAGQRERSG